MDNGRVLVILWMLYVLLNFTAEAVEINLNISEANSKITCNHTKENPIPATVFEDEEFLVNVTLPRKSYNIDYLLYNFKNKSAAATPKTLPDSRITQIFILKAKLSMAGIWNLTILIDPGYNRTQPRQTYNKGNYAVASCFIKVDVRVKEAPQMILINKMIVPSYPIRDINQKFDYYAQYNYSVGDIVDVWCILGEELLKTESGQSIEFYYEYAANLDEMFDNAMKDIDKSVLGYGFRTTLQEKHNNTAIVCNCTGPQDSTTIQVKFIQQEIHNKEDMTSLKINGLTVRSNKRSGKEIDILRQEFNYLFLKGEKVEVVCETHEINRSVIIGNEKCQGGKNVQTVTNNRNNPEIIFSICDDVRNNSREEIHVNAILSSLTKGFNESVALTVNLPPENIVMELHDFRRRKARHTWIYYEFDEGDTVVPNCSHVIITKGIIPKILYYDSDIEPKEIKLTSNHDKTTFQCSVAEKPSGMEPVSLVYKNLFVLFRKRAFTTTTMTTDNDSDGDGNEKQDIPMWALVILGLLMCFILVCVCTVVWKMRQRSKKRKTGVNNYENLHSDQSQDVAISPHPQQWSVTEESNYHVPADTRGDNYIYAEPVRGPDDPYAVVLPKNQRQKVGKSYEEPAYAEVNAYQDKSLYSNPGTSEYASVRELYAQVLPKHARKHESYDNTFPNSPYVNSKCPEYVEPTYCQAYRK